MTHLVEFAEGYEAVSETDCSRQGDIVERLIETATATGLPDDVFLPVMTSRRRRELAYKVICSITDPDLVLEIQVHGSGAMRAHVTMPCVVIEDGKAVIHTERQPMEWAEDGRPVTLTTKLDHRHLSSTPCAHEVARIFLGTIGLKTEANCNGGYQAWKTMMQLTANLIASRRDGPIEIVATLPLTTQSLDEDGAREAAEYEITDLSDPDDPQTIDDSREQLLELDARMAPNATCLMLLPPGLLVRRRHREIFHAG